MSGFFKNLFGRGEDEERAPMADQSSPAGEDWSRAAFEAAPVGMALTNRDHCFVHANQAFCDLLGYTEDELQP